MNSKSTGSSTTDFVCRSYCGSGYLYRFREVYIEYGLGIVSESPCPEQSSNALLNFYSLVYET